MLDLKEGGNVTVNKIDVLVKHNFIINDLVLRELESNSGQTYIFCIKYPTYFAIDCYLDVNNMINIRTFVYISPSNRTELDRSYNIEYSFIGKKLVNISEFIPTLNYIINYNHKKYFTLKAFG